MRLSVLLLMGSVFNLAFCMNNICNSCIFRYSRCCCYRNCINSLMNINKGFWSSWNFNWDRRNISLRSENCWWWCFCYYTISVDYFRWRNYALSNRSYGWFSWNWNWKWRHSCLVNLNSWRWLRKSMIYSRRTSNWILNNSCWLCSDLT